MRDLKGRIFAGCHDSDTQQEFFGGVRHPVWMFDSSRSAAATTEDGKLAEVWEKNKHQPGYFDNCNVQLEEVLAMMQRVIDPAHFRTFKGWFNQTPGSGKGRIE